MKSSRLYSSKSSKTSARRARGAPLFGSSFSSSKAFALALGLGLSIGLGLSANAQSPATSSASSAARATKPDGSRPAPQAMAANQQAEAAFRRADKNGDGKLSRTEADHLPALAARFEQVDTDRDQHISLQEFNRIVAAD